MGVRERESLASAEICRETVCEKVCRSRDEGKLDQHKVLQFSEGT